MMQLRKRVISVLVATALLVSCAAPREVIPIVTPPDPNTLLVRPPAASMEPAHKAIALKKGDSLAGNSIVMRQNNLLCVDDRVKLTTLQKYILGIFPDNK